MSARKIILSVIMFLYLTTFCTPPVWAAPQVVGQSAVLIDARSGKILFEKNGAVRMAPASTTKVVTGIIAIELSEPTDIVTAGKNSTIVEPSAIGLKEGETIPMENLLYSLLLKSANDAAIAIAEHIAGSVPQFTALMNQKAREWGATGSNFVNPNGLPDDNHYSTARDLAVIAGHAMKNPEFRKIVATKVKVIPRADDSAVKWLENHNRLLWRYDGANGIKTGYTRQAKQCLIASAAKGDQEFIAVILASEGNNIWTDAKTLLDYGFANFATYKQTDANRPVTTIKVADGTKNVTLLTKEDFYYTLPKGQTADVTHKIELNKNIMAPVKKGQVLGKLKYYISGSEIGAVSLIAQEDVPVKTLTFAVTNKSVPASPLLVGALVLGLFIVWHIRKRRRRMKSSNRLWINRNLLK